MTIVITGATGFLGGALAKALLARGEDVRGVARPGSDRSRLAGTGISWVRADVTHPQSLAAAFEGATAVIHAAGRLGAFGVPESTYFDLHVTGTRNVCAALQALPNPPRLLYVSSPGVLGPIAGPPATEEAPRAPSNAYERSKAAGEEAALDCAARGLPVIIARPEFIYGPGDTHVLGLFQVIQNGRFFYIGSGRNTCHPTYVDDAVDGLLRALEHGRAGAIYHFAGPRPVTFRELATTFAGALDAPRPRLTLPVPLAMSGAAVLEGLARLSGRTPPLSRDGVAFFSEDRRFSWEKAQRELGYEPSVDLAEGAARTVAWYRKQGYL